MRLTLPLALIALMLAGLAFAIPAGATGGQRLVVRGEDTVTEADHCPAGVCELRLTDGRFRGTPVGTGAYTGTIRLRVADAFPNGEEGVCAPIQGRITLGAGTPDRLVLALAGDSCQDGTGDLTMSSFTGLARFTVVYGTGTYAGASGGGVFSAFEDAADRERITLIGRLRRP